MASSSVVKLVCLVLACMVVVAPLTVDGAITCDMVVSTLSPCLTYLLSGGSVPADCCNAVRSLNTAASSTPDRQTACGCLKSAYTSIPGINIDNAASLPGKCGVNLPYKISPSIDCSKVT